MAVVAASTRRPRVWAAEAWTWAHDSKRPWRHASTWGWAMAMFVAAYILYFSVRTVEIHNGLGTSAYDFGLYDQGVWLLSRFKAPFVTLMGRSLFGDHTSLILLFVAPFYWISASTSFRSGDCVWCDMGRRGL